jgi:hypothetical protein
VYGKLFASMYDGSLATVGPWEALVTFQQFVILADREGFVDMTHEAISRRTIIPLQIIRKGIEVLEQPDPQSRDEGNEGRRILRIADHRDWGWKIVNYAKYRAIRSADERREYMREYMRKQAARGKEQPLPPNFDVFWAACPRKVGKGAAEKSWRKIAPDEALTMQIVKAMTEQRACEQWTRDDGKFIPHPATWLNRKGWLDEMPAEVDYGRCHYCTLPAIGRRNERAHCARPQHIEWAKTGTG